MRLRFRTPSRTLAVALVLLLGVAASTAQTRKPPKTDVKDPPGTEVYMAQFRLLFDKLDLDKDNYLDKEELAKGFRGPSAKPYDYAAPKSDTEKDKDKSTTEKPDPDKKDSDSTRDKPADKADYSKYPDYSFLIQLDTDKDQKISYDEFMSWAREYSVQLREQAEVQQKLLQAQVNLSKYTNKPNGLEYKRYQSEYKHHQEQLQKIENKIKAYERHLAHQQHIKVPTPVKPK